MGKRCAAAVLGTILAILAIGAASASAATEAGNNCEGNGAVEGDTLLSFTNAVGNPLPATVPVTGVITQWKVRVVPIPPGVLAQTLKVFRATGVASQYQVVGESAPGSLVTGLNTFPTRIPVKAGDLLGASGAPEVLYCMTPNVGDTVGAVLGNPTLGATPTFSAPISKIQIPNVAVIEADADGDGYGDETQDKCPQSAAFQSECPVVKVSASSTSLRKGSVVVLVTVNNSAPVKVKGTVSLGKGKRVKMSGGSKKVAPGQIARFKLVFPEKLKSKLEELGSRQSLQLKIDASATNVAGKVTHDRLRVRLRGQG